MRNAFELETPKDISMQSRMSEAALAIPNNITRRLASTVTAVGPLSSCRWPGEWIVLTYVAALWQAILKLLV